MCVLAFMYGAQLSASMCELLHICDRICVPCLRCPGAQPAASWQSGGRTASADAPSILPISGSRCVRETPSKLIMDNATNEHRCSVSQMLEVLLLDLRIFDA